MTPDKHKSLSSCGNAPELQLQTTTLWDYPSQHYGEGEQGSKHYVGATPSYVIWNLLKRYTRENDVVLDPMCGSGTTLDVCQDLKRKGLGYDLAPFRPDIQQSDARHLPLKKDSVDFVFLDPPYSTHIEYSDHAKCIGKLAAETGEYFVAMDQVFEELSRVLKNKHYLSLYVCDSFKKGKPFNPIGLELFALLMKYFKPVDIICVTRHNKSLKRNHWHTSALEGNYFLRGFNYLFIMRKESGAR